MARVRRRRTRNAAPHAQIFGTVAEIEDVIDRLEEDIIPRLKVVETMNRRQLAEFNHEWQAVASDIEIILAERDIAQR